MSLPTFFSISGLNPRIYTYNAANPNAPYASAYLFTYGGITHYYQPFNLQSQYDSDAIVLGYDPSTPGTTLYQETIPEKRSSLRLSFAAYNVTDQNQFLLLFQFQGLQGSPSVEFFVGSSLVSTEALEINQDEQHAILFDCPNNGYWFTIWVRLVSNDYWSVASFKGLDCFLL